MTWLAASPGTKRLALPRKPSNTTVCSQATFDGGPEDPRTLVYLYQQGMRAALLGGVADEVARAAMPAAVPVAEAPHPTVLPRPAESMVSPADQSTYPLSIAA